MIKEHCGYPVKIGYKIAEFDSYRCHYHSINPYHVGLYVPMEWTWRPMGYGGLGVFDTLESAMKFIKNRRSTLRIFECEYIESDKKGFWYLPPTYFIGSGEYHDAQFMNNPVPEGTVFAEAIKITRMVYK